MIKGQPRIVRGEIEYPKGLTPVYSDLAIVTHAKMKQFDLIFALLHPIVENGPIEVKVTGVKAVVNAIVEISPENAKKLLLTLKDNIESFEKVYGPIYLEPT